MSLLNTGLSGLNAAQVGLQTAGHNIANASTPGFSRQQIVQTTNTPLGGSAGMIGQGVNVASVQRVYDDFLLAHGLQAQSQSSQLDGYYSQMQQIDGMFGDTNSGLSPVLQGFFGSVQGLANNPESISSRQQLLSSAQTLASRFQALDQRFSDMGGESNAQITNSVTEINSLAQSISKLNFTIRQVQGTYIQPSNDLMDQRDQLLTQLNLQIGTTTVKDSDGSLSVFIGNGQPLVTGSGAMTLTTTPSAANSARLAIGYVTGGRTSVIADSSLQGGKLGAFLAFRTNTLDGVQNALGRIATGLAQTFNDQHALGQDQNGVAGGVFFNSAVPRVIPNSGNTFLNSTVTASIGDVNKLTTSDYEFSYDGTNSTLKRLSDNVSASVVGKPTAASPLNFDGIIITGGTVNVGDRFLIQPTHNGARDFSVAITDTAKIAAAASIRTNAAAANIGSGLISAGTVNSPNNKVVISFTSPTAFNVLDSTTGATLATNMAYTSGGDISFNGWTTKISNVAGAPLTNDTFTVEHGVTSTNSTKATIGVTTLNSPPVDPFLGNTVKVVFDSASSFHLEGTANNVTGISTVAATLANVTAGMLGKANGLNNGSITITTEVSDVSKIGTGGKGSYTSTGSTLTITGGTISGATADHTGTVTVSGAVVTVSGGSYPGSTTFSGASISINELTGAISIGAPSSPTITASTKLVVTAAGAANLGTGGISAGSVVDPTALTGQSYKINFTDPFHFNVTNTTTGVISAHVSYVADGLIGLPGLQFKITGDRVAGDTFSVNPSPSQNYDSGVTNQISVNGWTAEITGSPSAGDSFMVSANAGGTADNRNALLLGGLQIKNTLNGGTSSYQSTYGQLVSEVGNKTREMEATSKAQSTMVTQILQEQQSMSGVNLDEEATSLMRYQQAYQASAKVLQLSNTLWQTLLDIK